jgi:DHA1 family bicyclomycin/chloramphenicol resistance-like MFS transporter
VILSGIGLFVLAAVYFRFPESKQGDPDYSLKPIPIIINFHSVLREPQFYTYALTGSIASAGLYAYIAGSPFVFMELFHVSERQYGWIFAMIAMGLIGSSQLNSVLLKTYRSEQIIKVALLAQSITGVLLLTLSLLGRLELFSTIFFIFLFLCCQGFTFPNSSALSLAPFSRKAGTASALLGALQMSIGACTTGLVSLLTSHSAIPMTLVMACCATTSFLVLTLGSRIIRYRASIAEVEEQGTDMISIT